MGKLSCLPGWSRFSSKKKPEVATFNNSDANNLTTKSKGLYSRVWPGDELLSRNSTSTAGTDMNQDNQIQEPQDPKPSTKEISTGFTQASHVERLSSAPEPFTSSLKHVEEWVQSLEELSGDELLSDVDVDPEEQEAKDVSAGTQLSNLVVQYVSPLSETAHLSGIGLKSIPMLGAFNNLKSLSISGNSIVRIDPACLPRSLQFLDLSRNNLSAIEGLRGLNRLRALNLSHNRITRVGHGLRNCTGIRELNLSSNKISEVDGLHRLRKLSVLDLSNNRLTTAKSLLQLSANYSSLQALNLLGNAVVLNLGEDQLRRLVATIVPNLAQLNKKLIKPTVAATAVARASSAPAANHHYRKARRSSGKSKAKRVESLQAHSTKAGGGTRRRKHF